MFNTKSPDMCKIDSEFKQTSDDIDTDDVYASVYDIQ